MKLPALPPKPVLALREFDNRFGSWMRSMAAAPVVSFHVLHDLREAYRERARLVAAVQQHYAPSPKSPPKSPRRTK